MKKNQELIDGYIMIVDDNSINVDQLKKILGVEKYEVKAFANSKVALNTALSSSPSLILVDIDMPEMDGFEFCRLFKECPDKSEVPIIFIRSHADTTDIINIFEAGAADYITKPFQNTEVLARISTHLELYITKIHLDELVQKSSYGTIYNVTEKYQMQEIMIKNEKIISMGRLATGMAHEIRNPLSAISQFFQMMARKLNYDLDNSTNIKAAEDAGTTIESIKHFITSINITPMFESIDICINRIVKIIDNMHKFSQKGIGIKILTNLPILINNTLDIILLGISSNQEFSYKHINIVKQYDNNIPDIMCFDSKIQQVILNILHNGADIMMNNGIENPQFTIRIKYTEGVQMISIEIEDNGPGISDEIRSRIFEPFFTTKPDSEGTGLGLSISNFIITKDHGGELLVESQMGKGAKFIINLPLIL
ncbi:MAG: response regulator [Spirochaetaceae bacterium]